MIKVITYNYRAGVWEPIIEKTSIGLEIVQDHTDDKFTSSTYNITISNNSEKPQSAFNINISDLTVKMTNVDLFPLFDNEIVDRQVSQTEEQLQRAGEETDPKRI